MTRFFLLAAATLAMIPAAHAATPLAAIDAVIDRNWADLDALYIDLHSHPELGFQEQRTATLLAERMRKLGFAVTEHVGKTGIVAVYHNGAGPVAMVRTELDALPMEEKTGLAYASRVQAADETGRQTFVAHSCGHDNHMAAWIGTAEALVALKDRWHGTLLFVGQPAEELVSGGKAMLADGLFTRFPKPDYGFAAHVGTGLAGTVVVKQGPMTSAVDTILITFKGVGSHGSMADKGIDPIVEAAHFVTDVQSVVAREKDPFKFGVVTIGSFHAGSVSNIIPDHADLQLTLRSYDPDVRRVINEGVERTARAEADMARAPAPDIRHTCTAGPVITDTQCADKAAFVINGDDVVLRNLTFARIRVPDRNGAGVRHQGQDLTIENCRFINNEIGLLSSAPATARITIRDSRFERNGLCVDGRCLPSVSVPAITVLRMERSVLTASRGGSLLRSGAVKTVLLGNAFGGGSSGTAETLLLASGDLRAEGNRFERDADAQEAPAITLRALWHTPEIIVRDNTLLNHGAHPAVLLENLSSAEPTLEGNTVDANDILVSNAGLLAARAKDTGHRTYDATAPLRSGLRHLEQKLMPK